MGPGDLAQVLRPLMQYDHPDLLIGLKTTDDAAVFRLNPQQAIIQTLDFFPPVVDDPYTFGAIAAANAMSDVYAMGGEVLMALNIAAFPDNLPYSILTAIFQGGADKVAEGGGVIAGGHTVNDREPKYGLSVTGVVDPARILTKRGAKAGDRLYLTKRLGTGVITTALKNDQVKEEHLSGAVASMTKLNASASRLIRSVGVHACTDVTGFGLLGHAAEMTAQSKIGLHLKANLVPLLPGALEYAAKGLLPGGAFRNRDYLVSLAAHEAGFGVSVLAELASPLVDLLFDPETSGGLLCSVDRERAPAMEAAFADAGEDLWYVGEVVEGRGIALI